MKKRKFKIGYIAAVLFIGYLGYVLVNQHLMMMRFEKELQKYAMENAKLEESNSFIRDQIEFAQTVEYKERIARERIGLIKPGETVYIIDNPSN